MPALGRYSSPRQCILLRRIHCLGLSWSQWVLVGSEMVHRLIEPERSCARKYLDAPQRKHAVPPVIVGVSATVTFKKTAGDVEYRGV